MTIISFAIVAITFQVEREERNMPLNLSTLLGEVFARCRDATVHYSLEADNDDTLAAYAQVDLGSEGGIC